MRATIRSTFALVLIPLAAACSSGSSSSPAPAGSTTAASAQPTSAPAATPATPQASGQASGQADSPVTPSSTAADVLATGAGDVKITPVYHGTVMFGHAGKVFVVDPWSKGALDKLPKADVILITDIHEDHFDKGAIGKLKKESTVIVAPAAVAADLPGAKVLKNGEKTTVENVGIEAIPMYNKVRGPEAGKLYHDKGRGNGYVLSFGDKRVYLSGDTECTDEMKALKDIDLAFVCMNLPYTMPPAEAAECIKAFKPKVVTPYHYRDSNLAELTKGLEGQKGIEVRLKNFYP